MFYSYDDGEMAKFFGWTPETVAKRRGEYDLRGFEDLKKKIFSKSTPVVTYDALERQKETLEKVHAKKIGNLEKKVAEKDEQIKTLNSKIEEMYDWMIKSIAKK